MRRNKMSTKVLVFLIVLGLIVGGVIAEAFGDKLELLKKGLNIGFSPFTLDMYFFTFTLGFDLKINLGGVLGVLIVLLFYNI
jgi:hypothetical protein